jgi:hypothetical protein
MQCERIAEEQLQADKIDVLYDEAAREVVDRVEAHLQLCPACREEMDALRGTRRELQIWRIPRSRPALGRHVLVIPRWLAAAALVVLTVGAGLVSVGFVSVHRALAAQSARADALEQRHREAVASLQATLSERAPALDAEAILSRLDGRIDERIQQSQARERDEVNARLADWQERSDAQRRLDLARVAAGLSYLDGRHGEQVARTSELMGYVLEATAQKR